MRIALIGNPNSGKTTMYNALTGKNERVGNWAGVTVEKKEGIIKRNFYHGQEELIAVDLPGAYSMSPFTNEESVTRDFIEKEKPDVIINIVDASNLGRSLFFTTQLLELGIPVVVALNKSDINDKKRTDIDSVLLSKVLNCPVYKTISTASGDKGLKDVVEKAVSLKGSTQKAPFIQGETDLCDRASVEAADRKRFAFVKETVNKVEKRKVLTKMMNKQDKVDEILTNKWFGIPVFAVVMFLVFYISQSTLGTWIADWLVGWIEIFQEWVFGLTINANPFLQALLVDGIIGGVGAVVGFLPLVMVLYFLIALLEDCGYMARASVVLDPIFKRVGLSGKSVIPMVIGIGCAIPGIMACRTIRNERERRATAMLTPFMPCGAKIPVIALIAGVFFDNAAWVGAFMYFVGIFLVFTGALFVKMITGQKYKKSYFVVELPEYKVPSLKRATFSMLSRGKEYIIKAATVILVCNAVVQIMQTFNWQLQMVGEENANASMLATLASPIAILLVPVVGIAAWQLAAATITGFIAKENVVGTLAVCYGLSAFIDTDELALIGDGNVVASTMALTKVAALAFLMLNLFTPPCFAAIGAMNAEMQSRKWLWGGIFLQLGTGYTLAFLVYQFGTLFTTKSFGPGFAAGLIAVLAMVLIIKLLAVKAKKL